MTGSEIGGTASMEIYNGVAREVGWRRGQKEAREGIDGEGGGVVV